jgi:hypothetical protein
MDIYFRLTTLFIVAVDPEVIHSCSAGITEKPSANSASPCSLICFNGMVFGQETYFPERRSSSTIGTYALSSPKCCRTPHSISLAGSLLSSTMAGIAKEPLHHTITKASHEFASPTSTSSRMQTTTSADCWDTATGIV